MRALPPHSQPPQYPQPPYPPQPPAPPPLPLPPPSHRGHAQSPYPGVPLPYATPQVNGVPCPRCEQPAGQRVKFTWWGGAIGPKLFDHHKCLACGYTFNGRTGRPNTTAITIYTIVSLVITIAVGFAMYRAGFFRF